MLAGWLAGWLAAALVVAYAAARVALALAIIPQHTTHRPIAHRAVRLSLPVPLLSPPVILSPSATMATLGIDTEQCREKIRLLSLCSLASQRDEIAYADAAAVLQVAADDVEQWVVDAMTQQLIDARLDQQRQVIIVHASTQRTRSAAQFAAANGESQEEWVALKTRLDAWKSEMGAVLETMSKIQDSR